MKRDGEKLNRFVALSPRLAPKLEQAGAVASRLQGRWSESSNRQHGYLFPWIRTACSSLAHTPISDSLHGETSQTFPGTAFPRDGVLSFSTMCSQRHSDLRIDGAQSFIPTCVPPWSPNTPISGGISDFSNIGGETSGAKRLVRTKRNCHSSARSHQWAVDTRLR